MGNKILTIVVVLLVLVAIILGYSIYKQRFGTGSSGKSEQIKEQASVDSSSESQNPYLPSAEELGITSEELAALDFPTSDASINEKNNHIDVVRGAAKEAPYLDITKCEIADPVVLKIKESEGMKVRNQDSVTHTLVLDADTKFIIPAGATEQIKPDFLHGPGIYGYGCDNMPYSIGVLLVE